MPDYDVDKSQYRDTPCYSEVYRYLGKQHINVWCRHKKHEAMYTIDCRFTPEEVERYSTLLKKAGFDFDYTADGNMPKPGEPAYLWSFDVANQSQLSRLVLLNGLRYLWERTLGDMSGVPRHFLRLATDDMTPLELMNLWFMCNHALGGKLSRDIHDIEPYYGVFKRFDDASRKDFFESKAAAHDTRQHLKAVGKVSDRAALRKMFDGTPSYDELDAFYKGLT